MMDLSRLAGAARVHDLDRLDGCLERVAVRPGDGHGLVGGGWQPWRCDSPVVVSLADSWWLT